MASKGTVWSFNYSRSAHENYFGSRERNGHQNKMGNFPIYSRECVFILKISLWRHQLIFPNSCLSFDHVKLLLKNSSYTRKVTTEWVSYPRYNRICNKANGYKKSFHQKKNNSNTDSEVKSHRSWFCTNYSTS